MPDMNTEDFPCTSLGVPSLLITITIAVLLCANETQPTPTTGCLGMAVLRVPLFVSAGHVLTLLLLQRAYWHG